VEASLLGLTWTHSCGDFSMAHLMRHAADQRSLKYLIIASLGNLSRS
jgi:hypothetical protein